MLKQHVSLFKYICLCRSLFCQAKTANHCLPKKPFWTFNDRRFIWTTAWTLCGDCPAFASYYCNSSIYIYQFAVHFTRLSHEIQQASSTFHLVNKHSGDSKHSPVEEFGKFPTKLLKILSARRCWKFNQPLDFTMENLRHHVEVWSCRGRFSRNLEWSFGTGSWGTTDRWCRDCFFGYNDMICGGSRGSKNVSWKRFFFLWRGGSFCKERSLKGTYWGIIEGAVLLSEQYQYIRLSPVLHFFCELKEKRRVQV